MVGFVNALFARTDEAEGQGLVEYSLILVLVSIACIALLTALGVSIGDLFARVTAALGV